MLGRRGPTRACVVAAVLWSPTAASSPAAAAPQRQPVEVLQWALEKLEPFNLGDVYQEAGVPQLKLIKEQLKAALPKLPKQEPWTMYGARLAFDISRFERKHARATRLGQSVLKKPACRQESGQESGEECFPAVFRHLLLEAYRSGDLPAVREIFEANVRQHPRVASYTTHFQVPPLLLARDKASKPFWSAEEVPLARTLEEHADEILEELAGNVLEGGRFRSMPVSAYQEHRDRSFLHNTLQLCSPWLRTDSAKCWQEFNVYVAETSAGAWSDERCAYAPRTCRLLQQPEVVGRLNRHDRAPKHDGVAGKAGFLRLMPNTTIMAHTGPHNGRLTIHLGLKIPEGSYIEVAGERRSWEEKKALILDDSFIHQVVNTNLSEDRIILLVHIWHPDLVEELGYEDPRAAAWREGQDSIPEAVAHSIGAPSRRPAASEL